MKKDAELKNKIIEFVGKRYKEELELIDLAQHLNYTYAYTSRKIKKLFGLTFVELRNRKRIDTAKRLLQNRFKTIKKIAFEVGFPNEQNLYKNFLKFVGVGARAYRKLFEEVKNESR